MKKTILTVATIACVAVLALCGCKQGTVTKGSTLFGVDSLSYCLGANIGYGVSAEMVDVPFDYNKVEKGMKDGALETTKQTQEEAIDILRDYFVNKLRERRQHNEELAADSLAVGEPLPMFENDKECSSVSYAFGNDIGCNLRTSGLPLQISSVVKGFSDARQGKASLDENAVREYIQNYFTVVRPAEEAEKSAKWLEKMEKKSGVQKTESGLLYKVINAGDMEKAAKNDNDVVKVHYVGRTTEGKVFDTSLFEMRPKEQQEMMRERRPDLFDEEGNIKENEPIEFPLNRVIKGWTEGMKLVGPGGKIVLYIPSALAYGQRGAGRDIGPNAALEFEVDLLEVIPAEAEEVPAE